MVRYLETGSTDPRFNLALEEYVLLHRLQGDYLLLWQNENTVVVGRNQNTAEEINGDFVAQHGIRVVRRITGGGAVYHDLGNLNYSFITDAGNVERMSFRRFTEPVVRALRGLGLEAEASGRNDILVSGCKVSGTAQHLAGTRVLHHGTLLFDADADMVSGALQVDPAKFQSKSAKSVRSRIGNIRDYLPADMTMQAFWTYLRGELSHNGYMAERLGEEELQAVRRLQAEKYDTWEWNFGHSPAYAMKARRRFAGGTLEVQLSADRGCIRQIAFFGDFLALRDLTAVCDKLIDCPLRRDALAAKLSELPLAEYFGAITADEVVRTILDQGGEGL